MKGFLFFSGQVAIDLEEGGIFAKDVREQTVQAMENIKAILQAAGDSSRAVDQSNVYFVAMSLFRDFNDECEVF
jgi:2-iminobutanoate/2-iminopropanoate deaminase